MSSYFKNLSKLIGEKGTLKPLGILSIARIFGLRKSPVRRGVINPWAVKVAWQKIPNVQH